jgi:hypothetical protein
MSTPDPMRLADIDPLVLTSRARVGQVVGAVALDALVPLACIAAAIVAFATHTVALGWVLIVAAVAVATAAIARIAHSGRSLGGLAAGTRTVLRSNGAPAGARVLPALFTGGLGVFDLTRGRDPFAPALAPFPFPEPSTETLRASRPPRSHAPVVQLDSGQRLTLESALVLGRKPSAAADAPGEVYQWPDLSRTLSKSHTRLEWDGRRVWVTDLGSTNGTHLRTPSGSQPLIPFQRTPVPPDAELELGDRVVTVRSAA